MVAGGWVLSEGVWGVAVTGPGFLLQEKNGETPGKTIGLILFESYVIMKKKMRRRTFGKE